MTLGLEEVAALVDDALELLTIGKVVPRKLFECFVFLSLLDEFFHLHDDLIKLALFLQLGTLRHLAALRYLV